MKTGATRIAIEPSTTCCGPAGRTAPIWRSSLSVDALADALLNPRDRSYSVTQLFETLDRNGLSFARWSRQAPYLPTCGAIASTPHADRLTVLSPREQYAAMELWRGTMSCHSAIVHRRACDATIHFDDERWRRFVPLLLNTSHQHDDLILPLDADDCGLFERIDRCRTSEDIAAADVSDCGRVRTFFETLWSYDQVVFDASRAG